MVSLFGTIRRNLRPDNWNNECRGNSGFLTSFGAGPGDNVCDGHRTISKKSPLRCPDWQGTVRNGFHKNQHNNVCLDQNRNARLPNFYEKNIFSPVMNDRMTRTNLSLEGLQRQPKPIHNDLSLTNYRIIKVLGKGTFAKVKLAEHIPTGHKVAIKVIDKNRLTEADLRKIQREIEIMKCLNHPNIIRLYEVIEDSNLINIVMEYAAKGEIYDYIIHKKRLTEDDARSKFRQLLSAIAYCHSKNIVHRDLKVENLLLDKDHNVKVCDFGFGNFFDRDNKLDTFCGSPPYAAPELFRGDKYIGPEVDVWSLGVILFTFLTGSLPFNGKTLPALKSDVMKGNFVVPNYIRVGSELFLRKFLRVVPEDRITLDQAMVDSWMTYGYVVSPSRKSYSLENPINTAVLDEMIRMGYQEDDICESLEKKLFDDLHVTYRILCVRNEETSFFESVKNNNNSNNTNNTNNNSKGAQFKSEMALAQGFDAEKANGFESAHHINSGKISGSNHHHDHHHHNHHEVINDFRVMTPKPPPRGLRRTPDIQRCPTNLGTEQQERFIRRYSMGVRPDLIINVDANMPVKQTKVSRISSLRVKLTSDDVHKRENYEEQTPKMQKSIKKLSRSIFKRTRYVDLATKEEVGFFARVPSVSLRTEQTNCNSTSIGNSNLAIDKNVSVPQSSNMVSHHLTLDTRLSHTNVESFRKTPSNQSLTYPQFNQPPTAKYQGPTFKEKFIDLFRIKRNRSVL